MDSINGSVYRLYLRNREEIYISFIAKRAVRLIERKLVKGEWEHYLIPVILMPFSEDEEEYWIRFVLPSQGKIICSKGWE